MVNALPYESGFTMKTKKNYPNTECINNTLCTTPHQKCAIVKKTKQKHKNITKKHPNKKTKKNFEETFWFGLRRLFFLVFLVFFLFFWFQHPNLVIFSNQKNTRFFWFLHFKTKKKQQGKQKKTSFEAKPKRFFQSFVFLFFGF